MSLEEIKEDALKLKKLRDEKDQLNDRLKMLNESIKDIEEYTLSRSLDEAGISDITLNNVHIKKSLIFRGGYTKSNDKDDFKFLFDTNNEGALKQQVVVDLGQNPEFPSLLEKYHIPYEIVYSVHHMTLSSILKELVNEGKISTEDFERYNIYAQPQIKVEVKGN